MEEIAPKDVFLQSLDRCVIAPEFMQAFYDRFLGSSEEIRNKFAGTDMYLQKQMLIRSLKLSAGATAGDRESLQEINDRAETHARDRLNVRPELYNYWLDAIIAAAEEFDPQWEPAVESAWRRILGHVIKHMVRRY